MPKHPLPCTHLRQVDSQRHAQHERHRLPSQRLAVGCVGVWVEGGGEALSQEELISESSVDQWEESQPGWHQPQTSAMHPMLSGLPCARLPAVAAASAHRGGGGGALQQP